MDISERATAGATLTHRSFDLEHFEFRDANGGFAFDGVASAVDRAYEVNDMFGTFNETISAGAFDKSIKDIGKRKAAQDIFLFVNHRHQDVPMASRNAGTLKLSVDPNLRAEASLDPQRPDVVIARSAIMRGEMTQMSIGFTVNKGRDTWNKDFTERTIHEVNLREVSIVPIGANPYTSASVRSFDEWIEQLIADDLTDEQIERAYNFFAELRTPQEIVNPFADRDAADRQRHLKRARSPYVA